MKKSDKIKYWVDIAEYDLKTAKVMLESKRFLYVGFMCHQSIEKILKHYIQKLKTILHHIRTIFYFYLKNAA